MFALFRVNILARVRQERAVSRPCSFIAGAESCKLIAIRTISHYACLTMHV